MLSHETAIEPRGPVSHSQDEPELTSAVELARQLVRGCRASLMLPVGEAGTELRVAAACGLPIPLAAATPRRLGEPVAGLVAQSRQPLLVNGWASSREQRGRYRTGSFISIPIPLEGATCGVLSVADPLGDRTFCPADLATLQSFAGYLASHLGCRKVQQHVRQLEGAVRELRRQVIAAQEAERQRIARDLHDEAGHALIEAIFSLDREASTLPSGNAANAIVGAARRCLIDCATTLHEVVFSLRPRLLEDLGLVAALRRLLNQAAKASGLKVDLAINGEVECAGQEIELAIFRVVQEAVTNIHKHARATTIGVRLDCRPDGLMVAVEDDGVGLDTQAPRRRGEGGHGLAGMRERVEVLGGTLDVGRGFCGGTRLVAWVPVRRGECADGRAKNPRDHHRGPRGGT